MSSYPPEITPPDELAEPDPPFQAFDKIARLNREVVVTEKLDGTNACVCVAPNGHVLAGSRSRWVTPAEDNFGFAKWVLAHEEELRVGLGFGTHYGEWWGAGIGRRYRLKEKRFSLFNTERWGNDAVRPACCHVVPEIHRFTPVQGDSQWATGIALAVHILRHDGSRAAPGFMKPEGIVVYHTASRQLFKVTLEGDESPKSALGGG